MPHNIRSNQGEVQATSGCSVAEESSGSVPESIIQIGPEVYMTDEFESIVVNTVSSHTSQKVLKHFGCPVGIGCHLVLVCVDVIPLVIVVLQIRNDVSFPAEFGLGGSRFVPFVQQVLPGDDLPRYGGEVEPFPKQRFHGVDRDDIGELKVVGKVKSGGHPRQGGYGFLSTLFASCLRRGLPGVLIRWQQLQGLFPPGYPVPRNVLIVSAVVIAQLVFPALAQYQLLFRKNTQRIIEEFFKVVSRQPFPVPKPNELGPDLPVGVPDNGRALYAGGGGISVVDLGV